MESSLSLAALGVLLMAAVLVLLPLAAAQDLWVRARRRGRQPSRQAGWTIAFGLAAAVHNGVFVQSVLVRDGAGVTGLTIVLALWSVMALATAWIALRTRRVRVYGQTLHVIPGAVGMAARPLVVAHALAAQAAAQAAAGQAAAGQDMAGAAPAAVFRVDGAAWPTLPQAVPGPQAAGDIVIYRDPRHTDVRPAAPRPADLAHADGYPADRSLAELAQADPPQADPPCAGPMRHMTAPPTIRDIVRAAARGDAARTGAGLATTDARAQAVAAALTAPLGAPAPGGSDATAGSATRYSGRSMAQMLRRADIARDPALAFRSLRGWDAAPFA